MGNRCDICSLECCNRCVTNPLFHETLRTEQGRIRSRVPGYWAVRRVPGYSPKIAATTRDYSSPFFFKLGEYSLPASSRGGISLRYTMPYIKIQCCEISIRHPILTANWQPKIGHHGLKAPLFDVPSRSASSCCRFARIASSRREWLSADALAT